MRLSRIVTAAALVLTAATADAVTLSLRSETTPFPGVTVRKYRTSGPSADAWVAIVDLCAANVHVDSDKPVVTSNQTTGGWASANGAAIATNGDFYKTSPLRVYGDAVGNGLPWPSVNTGLDPRYATEWYYENAGWIGFGFDQVTYNHTGWVKRNPGGRTLGGWEPTRVVKTRPPDLIGVVGGFPELVTEGAQYTCSSPTATSCFPDRGDMRARHPRTAMGITEDRQKFILLVVDGRTSTSSGMYGSELAETMKKLGAWQAFNLDGGGSSQFWQKGVGYRNNYSGNNNGGGARAVLNHWGVWAGSNTGKPSRPGHCVSSPPCELIPATGGTIDNASACFQAFGPAAYWRKESAGQGGGLLWTNAAANALPSNWAWWQLELAAEGDYRVEYLATAPYAEFARAQYEVLASGTVHSVTVDQSRASGWTAIGTFRFAAGGGQSVRVRDNAPAPVASGQSIVVDAIRLVPVRPTTGCGSGTCEPGESCSSCPADCGACPRCGDGACNGAETCADCPGDCGSCCGNGACDPSESCGSCPSDCGACPRCGDGDCNGTENCTSCPGDCGSCCGDGTCDTGESCESCANDCGACTRCGDGVCDAIESCESCEGDCGTCGSCGDGICAIGEGCESCTADCGLCNPCGNGTCDEDESCGSCASDCGACIDDEEPADGGVADDGPLSEMPEGGCACDGTGLSGALALAALLLRRRR